MPADAGAVCAVIKESITKLCVSDHRDDPVIIDEWLANKNPIHVALWISNAKHHVFVLKEAGQIIGVGGLSESGEITLLYVLPKVRYRGGGKLMLRRLEDRAQVLGLTELTLTSTTTAHGFFRAAGYQTWGAPVSGVGKALSYPMGRTLSAQDRVDTDAWSDTPVTAG